MRKEAMVKRYHTVQTIGNQTVAEHSYMVCLVLLELLKNPSVDLLKAALFHDLAEYETGDIPAPVKWKHPELAKELKNIEEDVEKRWGIQVKLNEEEALALKYADMLELVMYCIDQRMLGNRNMEQIADRGLVYLEDLPYLNDKAQNMIDYLWSKHNEFKR